MFLVSRYLGQFLGINQPESEADLFSPYKAELQNAWNFILHLPPSTYFHGVRRKFTIDERKFLFSPEISPAKRRLGISCPRKSNWRMEMILCLLLLSTLKCVDLYSACIITRNILSVPFV
jgi:hypothetical protein